MNSLQADTEYALKVLDGLTVPPSTLPDTQINEDKSRNAAGCMTAFLSARLASKGTQPKAIERTTFQWSGGLVNLRNAVNDHLWTNLRPTFIEHFEELSGDKPSAYLMATWQPNETDCHVWAIPASIVHDAMPHFPVGKMKDKRTIRIIPGKNLFERYDGSPDLSPFYRSISWSEEEDGNHTLFEIYRAHP